MATVPLAGQSSSGLRRDDGISKAKHIGHNPDEFAAKVLIKEATFKRHWDAKLRHQIHDLPKFDDVMREAKRNL